MNILHGYRKQKTRTQYLLVFLFVVSVALACYALSGLIGYRVVAMILLMVVSLTAMLFDIRPTLFSALLSALIWDFFFIPPRFTLFISSTEDTLLFLMYFVIALVHAVLTMRIRQMEKKEREREEKAETLRLYSTLLNSLSHELRTPIATLVGASDTLLSHESQLNEKSRRELLQEISAASLRLNQQVGNLLNMSRLESGHISIRPDWCDVNELVHAVVNRIKETQSTQKIIVEIAENIPIFKLDSGLIEQVIYNLVSNATQYTPANAIITIRVAVVNKQLQVIVEDNGPGIPADETKKIFDKFYRLNNTRTGGTGLGLSIVKGFTEAHHGTVTARNLPKGGAQFIVTIPGETAILNF